MYPLDPALHSFLANKKNKTDLEILLYGVQANSPTKLTTVIFLIFFLQSFTSRLDLKSVEITVDLFSFFISLKKKIKNAQND